MTISVFDLFKIGIGPSSSHTVGPMRAAAAFMEALGDALGRVARIECRLYGSLGATGRGHASDRAVILGLMGLKPDTVDSEALPALLAGALERHRLPLPDGREIDFHEADDLLFLPDETMPFHPNGLRLRGLDARGAELLQRGWYSVGGGFIVGEDQVEDRPVVVSRPVPLPFRSAGELLTLTQRENLSIAAIVRRNERTLRDDGDIDRGLLEIWHTMRTCVERGCRAEGVLPGPLRVRRRAGLLSRQLSEAGAHHDPLHVMDWVNLYALAVNEENAAGGQVVTAPTNGAAGIIPAVLHYYCRFVAGAGDSGVIDFLLTAAAIGALYKENASISGAEVGCQGEVGVACSMAAAGLCAVLGGTPGQVENAAEIGMEHHLGLTCDPVGGRVQIPCIERNALAAVKAINAARMALRGDGAHQVSLDQVIRTMRETGADMMSKYKETSLGGLAVNIVEC